MIFSQSWMQFSCMFIMIFCTGTVQAQGMNSTPHNAIYPGNYNNGTVNSYGKISRHQPTDSITMGQINANLMKNTQGHVVLYVINDCFYCNQAIIHMQNRGIPFSIHNVEHDAHTQFDYQQSGGRGLVPLLVFGQRTMTGFTVSAFDQVYANYAGSNYAGANGGNAYLARPPSSYNPSDPAPPQGAYAHAAPMVVVPVPVARTPSLGQGYDMLAPAPAALRAAEKIGELSPGAVLISKIKNIPIYIDPSKKSGILQRLDINAEMIYAGEESDGLLHVTTSDNEGWVDKSLIRQR